MPSFQIPCKSRNPCKRPYVKEKTSPYGMNKNERCLRTWPKGSETPYLLIKMKALSFLTPMQEHSHAKTQKKEKLQQRENPPHESFKFSAPMQKTLPCKDTKEKGKATAKRRPPPSSRHSPRIGRNRDLFCWLHSLSLTSRSAVLRAPEIDP